MSVARRRQMLLSTGNPAFASSCCRCLIKRYKSSTITNKRCLYEVLEVSQNASKSEIRDAYVAKTKKIHPDRNISNPNLHDRFVELNEAYSTLKNAEKRSKYDQSKVTSAQTNQSWANTATDSPFGTHRYRTDNGYDTRFEDFDESQYTSSFRDFQFTTEKHKAEQKSANKYIIGLLLSFMFIGGGVSVAHIKFIRDRFKVHEDKVHQESSNLYETVREKARLNGPQKQLKILLELSKESPASTQKVDLSAEIT